MIISVLTKNKSILHITLLSTSIRLFFKINQY